MTKISSQVVAHSLSPQGDELLSVLVTFPRFILAELNTHRMLSKNSASSRAIPFNKMVESVTNNPFIPIAWQKEHSGMQGNEYLQGVGADQAETEWRRAAKSAVYNAKVVNGNGVTKQLCNRLLEPFMWHTVLVTGSVNKEGWLNFFDLRCPQYTTPVMGEGFYAKSWNDLIENHSDKDNLQLLEDNKNNTLFKLQHNKGMAEIHMMALAEAIYDSWKESAPKQLKAGEWHIPFEDKIQLGAERPIDNMSYEKGIEITKVKISTAMCARTSYTVVGDEKEFGYDKQIALHDRMINQVPLHASPMEHCARAMSNEEYEIYVKGKIKDFYLDGVEGESLDKDINGWCRNFKGFIQYREILENERLY
jgi:thymidylate synthase ThyX